MKYPLADYELMPDMSIVDADNMMSQPKGLTSASGVDVLTHALEAYASVMATDYTDGLVEAAKRYYAEIIMPFRSFAKKYTDKVKAMDVDIILPSHGPIYDKPQWILDLYADWTSDRVENKVVIPYVSMYESTTMLVDRLNKKLTEAAIEVKLFDLVHCDEGELSMELVDCATVVLGSSMVLAGPHPAAVTAAYLVNALRPKLRYYSIIGSYGWGG